MIQAIEVKSCPFCAHDDVQIDEFDEGPEVARVVAMMRKAPLARVVAMMRKAPLARVVAMMRKAPLARVVAMIIHDNLAAWEVRVSRWDLEPNRHDDAAPHCIAQLTQLLGVPFESVTHPASTPSKAAQAAEAKGKKAAPKKAKTKAGTAAAVLFRRPLDRWVSRQTVTTE